MCAFRSMDILRVCNALEVAYSAPPSAPLQPMPASAPSIPATSGNRLGGKKSDESSPATVAPAVADSRREAMLRAAEQRNAPKKKR